MVSNRAASHVIVATNMQLASRTFHMQLEVIWKATGISVSLDGRCVVIQIIRRVAFTRSNETLTSSWLKFPWTTVHFKKLACDQR